MRQNNFKLLSLTGFNITDFTELTKVRLSVSVVISSIAGYFLAVDVVNYSTLLLLTIGGYAMVGASNVFNQVFEKDLDKLMERTQNRPLPKNRIHPNCQYSLQGWPYFGFIWNVRVGNGPNRFHFRCPDT